MNTIIEVVSMLQEEFKYADQLFLRWDKTLGEKLALVNRKLSIMRRMKFDTPESGCPISSKTRQLASLSCMIVVILIVELAKEGD